MSSHYIPFHRLTAPTSFFFVRHGQSVSNVDRRIQGHAESPLSDLGKRQARAAGRWFKKLEIDRVHVSPLGRAMETAEIIATEAGVQDIHVVPELIELHTGQYSGKAIHELEEHDPDLFNRFRRDSWEAVPDAERIVSLQGRAQTVWDLLLNHAETGNRTTLSVTHGGMIQWIIKATIGPAANRWMPLFPASNCGIFEFSAQSTMADPGKESPPAPNTGYYGEWRRVNHQPEEIAE